MLDELVLRHHLHQQGPCGSALLVVAGGVADLAPGLLLGCCCTKVLLVCWKHA